MPSCVSCKISRTKRNTERGITFHKFPKSAKEKNKWIKFIGENNYDPAVQYLYLCSRHFTRDSFSAGYSRKQLKTWSVPSIMVHRLKSVRVQDEIFENDTTVSTNSKRPVELINVGEIKRKIRHLEQSTKSSKKSVRRLQRMSSRQRKRIQKLKQVICSLENGDRQENVQEVKTEENCDNNNKLLRFFADKKTGEYPLEVKKFAITLHFLSPEAYEYIQRLFSDHLPLSRTLSDWHSLVDSDPNFLKEAIKMLAE